MRFILSFLLTFFWFFTTAQVDTPVRQSTYAEFAGNSRSEFSLNYERILPKRPSAFFSFAGRIGIGVVHREADSSGIISMPLELILLGGRRRNFFEISFGWTASWGKDFTDTSFHPPRHYPPFFDAWIIRAGYRYMVYKSVLLRIGVIGQWVNAPIPEWEFSVGLSMGYAF
jgi:hypothetical protein